MTRRTAHCSTKLPSAWPTHITCQSRSSSFCALGAWLRCAGRGRVFRRLVARALAQHFAGAFQEACLPYQFGLSTRACTEGLYIYKLLHTATWIVAVGYKCLHDLEDLCYVRQRTCYIKYVNLINMITLLTKSSLSGI